MEFDTSFPADREVCELVEQGEGLLDDVAELAQALDVRGALAGDHRLDAAASSSPRTAFESYTSSPRRHSGRSRGPTGSSGDRRDASTRSRVWVMPLTLAAVVMTCSGVPLPSQIRWCLLPIFRRSTGDGPVALMADEIEGTDLAVKGGRAQLHLSRRQGRDGSDAGNSRGRSTPRGPVAGAVNPIEGA